MFRFFLWGSLALVIQTNGTENFGGFGKNGNTPKGIALFPENFHWDEPFHLNSPQNFQGEMVSAPYENLTATAVDTLLQGTSCYKGNYWALTIISMEHPERSVIRDHSNHGRSNEPMNPCPEWIHRFIWLATMIRVSSDHWSWSASSQRTKLTVELVWHNVLQ